jgi:hypothetical protein
MSVPLSFVFARRSGCYIETTAHATASLTLPLIVSGVRGRSRICGALLLLAVWSIVRGRGRRSDAAYR